MEEPDCTSGRVATAQREHENQATNLVLAQRKFGAL